MPSISSGVGLVSGINSKDIIDQLMAIEAQPKDRLKTRIDEIDQQRLAYADLSTRLTTLRLSASVLKKPSSFTASAATSSDEDVLTATAAKGAAVGSYQFRVARLVTAQQNVSRGFADFNSAKVGAGTITLELGGGELNTQNNLSELNGGDGVARGQFRVTDRSGNTTVIDTSDAVTLDDVLKKFNNNLNVNIRAAADGDKIVLTDLSTGTGALAVQDIGDGTAAKSLGIAGTADVATPGKITGTQLYKLGLNTNLANLNDGRGVRTAASGNDFNITLGDGSTIGVSLTGKKTLGEVLGAINTSAAGKALATVAPDGKRIQIATQVGGTVSVAAVGTSKAAQDLGLTGPAAATLTGGQLLGSLGTTMLASLNGGQGLGPLGSIQVKSRAAGGETTIDLSGATTVQDVIDTINAANAGVKASLKSSGNGIQITDTSGGTGNLLIGNTDATNTATKLGLRGTFDTNTTAVQGANLQKQWVSESSLLADLNGGKGVKPGTFRITDRNGAVKQITLTQTDLTLGDVAKKINASGAAVNARVNDTGDGLLIEGTGGTGTLAIEDRDGTAAADLRIAGSSGTGKLDGSYEVKIETTATDTLASLQTKINNANYGLSASIVNDGSGAAPFRLSLTARNSGRDGRVSFDGGATTLDARTLVQAQDAAVFLGGSSDGQQPLLFTSSSNSIGGVVQGVTLDLNGVSDKPVTINVTRDVKNVEDEVQKFVDGFNDLVDKMTELTKYDQDTNTRGTLLGDNTVQQVQTEIYAAIQTVVADNGAYRIFADIGVTITDGAKLQFDSTKFEEAYAKNPDSVSRLFSKAGQSFDEETTLATLNGGRGVLANDLGADMRITVKDGSNFDIDLSTARTVGDVITAINTASGAKVTASLNALGTGFNLVDNTTTGTGVFRVQGINGSRAASDLGLERVGLTGKIEGRTIQTNAQASLGGLGAALESRINRLITPVSGIIPRQNQNLDDKTSQFQSRIDSIDKLLEQKRARLERQFANMESTLAKLQSQQSSLGQIQSVSTSRK
jgi:flagellar hook-associated protein 2